jgi:hypothetical protein
MISGIAQLSPVVCAAQHESFFPPPPPKETSPGFHPCYHFSTFPALQQRYKRRGTEPAACVGQGMSKGGCRVGDTLRPQIDALNLRLEQHPDPW